ncbi:O-antigen ligase family protein [Halobacterium salinarum]|uniref:O-antigen ligase family protein n=1 Tax=Halobacterium salinarum TaxID=2242 RepID=UPI0025556D79|nr:O-antigen ligase family protein [Halobacterium salinarum]MDL0128085.1 hypothetical protein [Halobacterium salinarum]
MGNNTGSQTTLLQLSSTGSRGDPQQFLLSTILLTALVGVFVPALALITGITGPRSAIFLAGAIFLYIALILSKRWIIAGISAAVVVFSLFEMGVPLTPYVGGVRVEITPVDLFLIPLGLFAILNFQGGKYDTVFGRCSLLFALWTLISGFIAAVGGYPMSGIFFGINQFRYPLIAFTGLFIARRFTFRYFLAALFAASSIHFAFAVIEGLLGHSLGLTYFGDVASVGFMQNYQIGPLSVGSGLYPGGFAGTSRKLLAIACLLFPVALNWSLRDNTPTTAYLIALGTPILVAISRSDTGLIVVPVATVATLLITKYSNFLEGTFTLRHGMIATGIGSLFAGFVAWVVLVMGVFGNSTVRVQQYLLALENFSAHPLTGIGGYNFSSVVVSGSPILAETGLKGVHNTMLAYLTELGLIGASLYIAAAGIAYLSGLAGLVHRKEQVTQGSILIGMIAFHAYSSLTLVYQSQPVMLTFWMVAGATIAGSPLATETTGD